MNHPVMRARKESVNHGCKIEKMPGGVRVTGFPRQLTALLLEVQREVWDKYLKTKSLRV